MSKSAGGSHPSPKDEGLLAVRRTIPVTQEPTKQSIAEERVAEWRKLTPQQQLEELDRRLGKGVGAVKQRARIQKAEVKG